MFHQYLTVGSLDILLTDKKVDSNSYCLSFSQIICTMSRSWSMYWKLSSATIKPKCSTKCFPISVGCFSHLELGWPQRLITSRCTSSYYFLKISLKLMQQFLRYFAKSHTSTPSGFGSRRLTFHFHKDGILPFSLL